MIYSERKYKFRVEGVIEQRREVTITAVNSHPQNRQTREKKFWNRFAHRYDRFMKVARQTYACLIRKIATYCDTSQTVLEIATGTGTIALALADHARQVHGCDISPAMLEIARRKLNQLHYTNVEFTVQDACQLTYPADSFDLVIAANTLHVMLQPQAALQAIRNVLKANGKLIAPTYCHGQSLVSRSLSAVMSLAGFKAFQKWSLDGYRSFLMEHGFQITEWEVIADSIPLVFAVAMKRSQS